MRKFSKGEDEAEVNMTPMLDIVFIMLIFFIVTASFVKERGMDLNKPEDQPESQNPPPPDPDKRPIGFVIDASNTIRHDGKNVALSMVSAAIKKASVERKEASVVIMAREGAHTSVALAIYDAAKEIGLPDKQIVMMIKK